MPRAHHVIVLKSLYRSAFVALVCAFLLVVPGASFAAFEAPVPMQPTAAAQFDEGGSITFSWTGTLQGDPVSINRSFFQVEIAAVDKVPAGQQSAWPRRVAWSITRAGQNETQLDIGVPVAGKYRWRVCAWGVADHVVSNRQEQLDGGCSPSLAFTANAVAAPDKEIGELPITSREKPSVTYITKRQPRTPVDPPLQPEQTPMVPAQPEGPVAAFQPLAKSLFGSGDSASSVSLGDSLTAAGGSNGLGSLGRGLGSNIPGLPIPFWVLALLALCVPVIVLWRRSILAMFEWEDGSIDGCGTMPELQNMQDDSTVKMSNELDDGAREPSPKIDHRDRTAA